MFANHVLVVCGVLAVACAPTWAGDRPVEQAPAPRPVAKRVTVRIPLTVLDAGEAASALMRKCVRGGADIVPLQKEDALIVSGTEADIKEVEAILRLRGEPEKAPKKPAVIPVGAGFDLDEVTKSVRKKFPAGTVIVPLPDEHSLLVYVTEKEAEEIRQIVNPPFETAPRPERAPMPRVAPKKYTMHFKRATWDEVLDWYAKESGLTLITVVKPIGAFSVNGKDRKFTLGEITDILNEAMMQQKFILIRRHLTFFIHPTDEKLDPTLVPRVTLSELSERGQTELVSVVIPVEGVVVDDVLDEAKKLLGPFGTITPLRSPNAVIVQDAVGNIAKIKKMIDELSEPKPQKK